MTAAHLPRQFFAVFRYCFLWLSGGGKRHRCRSRYPGMVRCVVCFSSTGGSESKLRSTPALTRVRSKRVDLHAEVSYIIFLPSLPASVAVGRSCAVRAFPSLLLGTFIRTYMRRLHTFAHPSRIHVLSFVGCTVVCYARPRPA